MLLMRHFCPFARRTGLESMVKPAECRGCGAVTFDKTRFLSKVWPPPRHSWLEVDLATDDTTVGSTPSCLERPRPPRRPLAGRGYRGARPDGVRYSPVRPVAPGRLP